MNLLSGYEVVEVDGLVFRRKRKASPTSSSTSSKAKRMDSEDTSNVGASEGNPSEEAAMPKPALEPAAADHGNAIMEEPSPGSRGKSDEAAEKASGLSEISVAGAAQATLQKLTESDSEAQKLLALCANIPKARLVYSIAWMQMLDPALSDKEVSPV